MFAPGNFKKAPGARSSISTDRWERALYEYTVLDRSARELGGELGRDHSTVIRKFQGMQRREPGILERLANKFGPAHDSTGQCTTSKEVQCKFTPDRTTRRRKAS